MNIRIPRNKRAIYEIDSRYFRQEGRDTKKNENQQKKDNIFTK